jgi:carbon-monoxide dehydrogenase small subunit
VRGVYLTGATVVSIEGLAEDAAMVALRAAFSVEHALQCGYCTPGMLITARDILTRLPDADDDRVRLELAGNLCRCTGYNGIVKAIRRVLDRRLNFDVVAAAVLPVATAPDMPVVMPLRNAAAGERHLTQRLQIAVTEAELWAALQDPKLVAQCVPGATLTNVEGTHIVGEMVVSLGPIQGRFSGSADVTYGDRRGRVRGEGQDRISKTRLAAAAEFSVAGDGKNAILVLDVSYSLRGALAQFARAPVVQAFAHEMTAIVAKNLAARLRGEALVAPRRLSGAVLIAHVLWRRLKKIFGGQRDD